MSDIERLAEHYGLDPSQAADLLDVLAWVRQRHHVWLRGFPSDLPGSEADVFAWDEFDAQMRHAAEDFEVAPALLRRLQR